MKDLYVSIEEALEEIRAGRMLIVTDDENRENEGDFIMAAEKVRPEDVNFMTIHGRGLLCQSISPKRAEILGLAPMVPENTSLHCTAFTVSVDARGVTSTGISAQDRAATIRVLADKKTRPEDLLRPGHIFPLIAKKGGVLERNGHTEAAMDLARLAGLEASGILCEILDTDGQMARLPRLEEMAGEIGLKIVTVEALRLYRQKQEARKTAEGRLPTSAGNFRIHVYENTENPEMPHLALVSEKPFNPGNCLTRVHSECLTGESLLSKRCDCREQLHKAMTKTAQEGGVVIYLRQEGRGIGLTEKIRAYQLQDTGFDTFDANIELGHLPDERDYVLAGRILSDLGISGVRLLTNNPQKIEGLQKNGIKVLSRESLEIPPTAESRSYLAAKKNRHQHHLELV